MIVFAVVDCLSLEIFAVCFVAIALAVRPLVDGDLFVGNYRLGSQMVNPWPSSEEDFPQ